MKYLIITLIALLSTSLLYAAEPAGRASERPKQAPIKHEQKRLSPEERRAFIKRLDGPMDPEVAKRIRESGPKKVAPQPAAPAVDLKVQEEKK
jgi:hypothetical protein